MTLIQRLSSPPPSRKPQKLALDAWIETLPEDERTAVYAAATNNEWGHRALIDVLKEAGAPVMSDNTLRTWRIRHGWVA